MLFCGVFIVPVVGSEHKDGLIFNRWATHWHLSPAISADGLFIAYKRVVAYSPDTSGELCLRDMLTRESEVLSTCTQLDVPPSISANGRFIAYQDSPHIYVYDRETATSDLVSVDSAGNAGNDVSEVCAISDDGRFVAFSSEATNLVPDDTNERVDVFVRDLQAGTTERVSVSSSGEEGVYGSSECAISADGRFVAFRSWAPNLVVDDTNNNADIFVHDRETGITSRVSVNSDAEQSNGFSSAPSLSGDGRWVVFVSQASNLVAADGNDEQDVFVHDRQTGETKRVSINSAGVEANGASFEPSISNDGQIIVFTSSATNFVEDFEHNNRSIITHDQRTQTTKLLTPIWDAEQLYSYYWYGGPLYTHGSVSANGRIVAYARSESFDPCLEYWRMCAIESIKTIHSHTDASFEFESLPLEVEEGGEPATYSIALGIKPIDSIVLGISGDEHLAVSPNQLVFDPNDWDIPQSVSVTALDNDAVTASGYDYAQISQRVVSGDVSFRIKHNLGLSVKVHDNDFVSVDPNIPDDSNAPMDPNTTGGRLDPNDPNVLVVDEDETQEETNEQGNVPVTLPCSGSFFLLLFALLLLKRS